MDDMAETPDQQDETGSQSDIVELITEDHEALKSRLGEVTPAQGTDRDRVFRDLTEALVRHEVAEEVVVYPALRRLDRGDAVADARISEQAEAESKLAELERFRSDTSEFATGFSQLQDSVLGHAQLEEREVLPMLAELPEDRRFELGHRYVRARSSAPTHPHPSAPDTPPGNVLAGPVAALFDRIRDAARHV